LQGYTALRETDFTVGSWMETASILRTCRPLETAATVKLQLLCWKTVVIAFYENNIRTLFCGTLLSRRTDRQAVTRTPSKTRFPVLRCIRPSARNPRVLRTRIGFGSLILIC
jgi:hypothetical protein